MENLCIHNVNVTAIGTSALNIDKEPKVSSSGLIRELDLETDRDYLEAYFVICRLYQEKRRMLFRPDNNRLVGIFHDRQEELSKEAGGLAIQELNTLLKDSELKFDEAVREGLDQKRLFMFEKMRKHFKLSNFEKKIYLFFLYLEYHEIEQNRCLEDELLRVFDTEDSVYARIQNARYFTRNAGLFEEGILCRTQWEENANSVRMKIIITGKGARLASEVFSGLWKLKENSLESDDSDNRIGYIKKAGYVLDDVKLEADLKEKICLFLDFAKQKKLEKLNITGKIKKGLGTTFLFYGPPGTGKSMLAEAIASYVDKKLLVVEYPKVMERWVGATDKNIMEIFKSAEQKDVVVLLDEADSLFYNRAYAGQEHDIRFVNEMLQELERFQGIIILTTNMDSLLDSALDRRVSLKIKFEHPDTELQCQIWQGHIPETVLLGEDVDFKYIANRYDFSGGNIKNAVLNAFRKMVARDDQVLAMSDLIYGADLERDGMFRAKNQIGFQK